MELYIVGIDRVDTSPDWFFITSEDYPSNELVEKEIRKQQSLSKDEFDDYINEYWVEKAWANGYKIKLVKEDK